MLSARLVLKAEAHNLYCSVSSSAIAREDSGDRCLNPARCFRAATCTGLYLCTKLRQFVAINLIGRAARRKAVTVGRTEYRPVRGTIAAWCVASRRMRLQGAFVRFAGRKESSLRKVNLQYSSHEYNRCRESKLSMPLSPFQARDWRSRRYPLPGSAHRHVHFSSHPLVQLSL